MTVPDGWVWAAAVFCAAGAPETVIAAASVLTEPTLFRNAQYTFQPFRSVGMFCSCIVLWSPPMIFSPWKTAAASV